MKYRDRGDRIESRGDRIESRGDRIESRGDRIESRGDRLESRDRRIETCLNGRESRDDDKYSGEWRHRSKMDLDRNKGSFFFICYFVKNYICYFRSET